jgi:hypothetical protein
MFDMHVKGILAKLAKTIPLSDSMRSSLLTRAEEDFLNGGYNAGGVKSCLTFKKKTLRLIPFL